MRGRRRGSGGVHGDFGFTGGNVRVGLEDNIYLSRGVFATNAQLVERAVNVIENMGASVIGPEAVRNQLGLTKRAPVAR